MNASGPRRILIALASDAPAETIFEPVFKIALQKRAPVECVCIEDTRLLDIAGMPQAHFIHAYSHQSSPLDEPFVRRAMRVTAVRTRERFAASVTRTAVAWSFRTRQADKLSEAFSDAAPGDLIVAPLLRNARNADQVRGLIDAVTERIAASLLVLNEAGDPDRSVLALFDGDRDDLAAARDLATDFGCALAVLAVGDDEQAAAELAHEAESFLAEAGQPDGVRAIVSRNRGDLDSAIVAAAPGTLVLDREGEAARSIDIVSLLTRSSASLFLRN